MANRLPLTNDEGEVRELDEEDFKHFIPFDQLPADLKKTLSASNRRGAQKAPKKTMVAIRLDETIVQHFRAQGRGWQTRLNDILKDYIARH